jgi:spore coat polysaccharide biosynthesis predicted glycosyltransferase SpsG
MNAPDAKNLTQSCSAGNPGQTPKPVLWVRTTASPQIGFGHLRRVLTLATVLRPSFDFMFLTDSDDPWTEAAANERAWSAVPFQPEAVWTSAASPAAILIDTRREGGLAGLILEAQRRGIPVASIHDLGLNPLRSDVVIDGSVEPCAPEGGKCFTGPSYLVLDLEFAAIHARKKSIRESVGSIFINLGGGDSSRYLMRVLEAIRVFGTQLDVVAAPGFAARVRESVDPGRIEPLRIRWADKGDSIAELFFQADLAITAGGLSVYESMGSGTPTLALSYDSLQHRTVARLAENGCCVDLGLGDSLDVPRLADLLRSLDHDRVSRRRLSRRGWRVVDGRGAARVAQILVGLLGRGASGCAGIS